MKKLLVAFYCLSFSVCASAQFSVSTSGGYLSLTSIPNLDALILFNGITPMSEITYTGTASNITWVTFDNQFYSNSSTISPEDGTGYILKINDVNTYWIWVIDYAKYPVILSALSVVESDDRCDNLKLIPLFTAPDLTYQNKNGATLILPRAFSFTYNDVTFSDDAWTDPTPVVITKTTPFSEVNLVTPFCNTQITMSGDQFAVDMGLTPQSVTSAIYQAVAVESHMKGTVSERTAKNELNRSGSDISGSGPLVVDFESRVNTLSANYYEWFIFKTTDPSNYIRYNDKNLRYTFTESGNYRARLVAASSACEMIDSLSITVLESSLEVPNVFTPNGDGINDEFRVVYKSLSSYSCLVFNRWGRKVFSSSDPGRGWDGRINGKMAAPGAYYYIVQATGTDFDSDGNPITYKLSGDINLLRGK